MLLPIGFFFESTYLITLIILGIFVFLIFIWLSLIFYRWISGEKAQSDKVMKDIKRSHQQASILVVKQKIAESFALHSNSLAVKRNRLLIADDYGIIDPTAWNNEVAYFLNKVVIPTFSDSEYREFSSNTAFLSQIFSDFIEPQVSLRSDEIRSEDARSGFNLDISPRNFELWCADELTARGWTAKATPASGDQGADVIAERDGMRVIIQCKLYSSPVGNKAVQEVFAANRYYGGTHAAVVSNAGYTASARRLAATTGVLLLDRSDLSRMHPFSKAHWKRLH